MLNDLRVPERHVVRISHNELRRPGKSLFRYFLGVKWPQVQILSARPVQRRFSDRLFCFSGVLAALNDIAYKMPFPIRGGDSDNGSEGKGFESFGRALYCLPAERFGSRS
jgi:hypothetical protein